MKRKKLIIGLGIVLGVIVALLAIFFVLSMPEKPEPIASEENSLLHQVLLVYGINDAVVDVTEERALIRYNLPDFINKTDAVFYIMGAASSVAPETEKIIIQTYQNFEPVDEITINTKDVISLTEGTITKEEFLNKIG